MSLIFANFCGHEILKFFINVFFDVGGTVKANGLLIFYLLVTII